MCIRDSQLTLDCLITNYLDLQSHHCACYYVYSFVGGTYDKLWRVPHPLVGMRGARARHVRVIVRQRTSRAPRYSVSFCGGSMYETKVKV